MADDHTITPAIPANHGLDYAWLKQHGTELIQQLAGDIWTDYNEHDPGVTTLEQLCYALTELSYRAEFPLQSLLADPRSGRIDTRRQALFVPRRILPCNPVTQNDYRKLLVDRLQGVANAWLTPRPARTPDAVNGLYDIALYAPGADPCACEPDFQPEAIHARAERVYGRHRNLCEDVHAIHILQPWVTRVSAVATIDDSRAPEAILAALLFNAGQFLSPELQRQPLQALLDAGMTTAAIFNGPLLWHGFISDDQLQPQPTLIVIAGLIRVMVRTSGVTGLRELRVRVGKQERPSSSGAILIPPNHIAQLDTKPGRDGYGIRLVRKGITVQPDPARVQRELDRLWAEYRRLYPLTPQYLQHYAVPEGRSRDVRSYYSVQNQYPNTYGINANGLPDNPPLARQAQARQLKGYLLVYDQLLANFFAQLAHVRDLFSTERHLHQTYFYQYLNRTVPDVAPLLRKDYRDGLAVLIRSSDPVIARHNRLLDFLLALYGETLGLPAVNEEDRSGLARGHREIEAKLALLHRLVASTRNRGRGFDYLAPASPVNIAGMEIKCRIQLGMDAHESAAQDNLFAELAIEIVDSETEASVGPPLAGYEDYFEQHFAVPPADSRPAPRDDALHPSPLRGQKVTRHFLRAAADPDNFRIGALPGSDGIVVVCRSLDQTQWYFIGRYPDHDRAGIVVEQLRAMAGSLDRHARQLYIVEHTLLRFGRVDGDPPQHKPQPFVYSFTITAVLPRPTDSGHGPDSHIAVREVIRQNTPAHIAIEYCFLRFREMRHFKSLYGAWRWALRRRDRDDIVAASARLRRFLATHRDDHAGHHEGDAP
jgi:hypothetical protein